MFRIIFFIILFTYVVLTSSRTLGPVITPAGIVGKQETVFTAELGKPLETWCLTYGEPPPGVAWYRIKSNGMEFISRGNLLQLNISSETVGKYVCQASNSGDHVAAWLVIIQAYQTEGLEIHDPHIILPTIPIDNSRVMGETTPRTKLTPVCSLPSDMGSCTDFSFKWYYDVPTGTCAQFWYGGCEGNSNRFTSKEECKDMCVSSAPKARGDDSEDHLSMCISTQYGCCSDGETPAHGPDGMGCCLLSPYECCPDNYTPALGPHFEGCECQHLRFGCCPDNVTIARGPDNKDCGCQYTAHGCCPDKHTEAAGPNFEGCSCNTYQFGCCPDSITVAKGPSYEGCSCRESQYECCGDGKTPATGPEREGCDCTTSEFGCCLDRLSEAKGHKFLGCSNTSENKQARGDDSEDHLSMCISTQYGCCSDGETPAHGPDGMGCCLLSPYECCPDNYTPALGPHFEGCKCQHLRFGCCPDNVTIARGPDNKDCGCQYTAYGCCPDKHTEAAGPNFEGCSCNTYQFGCCPDSITVAKGPSYEGCSCRESQYGCCGDGKTPATGPEREGCDCTTSEFGCCPDRLSEAKGHKFLGCSNTSENKQAVCSLPSDRGSCRNFSDYWYYDMKKGGCALFYYGGCDGNYNRFTTEKECVEVCVNPSFKGVCKLPKVKGMCMDYTVRWYYDSEKARCSEFIYGGCLGNTNNFISQQLCQEQCLSN